MIVWIGRDRGSQFNDGGRYNPTTDTWTLLSTDGAPSPREDHTVVWTGGEMIVWGGGPNGGGVFQDGGRYNPATAAWAAVNLKDYVAKPALIDPQVVADGIYACMANGVHIINISFEIAGDAPVLRNAIIAASNVGIVLVAAVGDNSSPGVLYTAKYPEVIAVTSIQSNAYPNLSLSTFSNWGPEVDFTAPGSAITSTWIGSTYSGRAGTGQAAAHVSGVAALMLSAGRADLIGKDVTPVPLPPEQQGLGLIDAYLTVTAE